MAIISDAEIRVYTTLSSNNADGFLKSVYDNPGAIPSISRVHAKLLMNLINYTFCARMEPLY